MVYEEEGETRSSSSSYRCWMGRCAEVEVREEEEEERVAESEVAVGGLRCSGEGMSWKGAASSSESYRTGAERLE